MHLLVRAFGIGEGDEVIITPFSFIASANCVLFERARPVFADIDPDTLHIDPALIAGAFGDATVFAFYANKQITTGEGGMIVTDGIMGTHIIISKREPARGHIPDCILGRHDLY